MRLLHFADNGEREYIILTDDDAINAEDFRRPGFKLKVHAVVDFTFEVGRESMLPTETELWPEA